MNGRDSRATEGTPRVSGRLSGSTRRRTIRLGADPHAAGEARAFVRSTLASWGLREAQTGDVLLAVSELVSNAVQHGAGHPRLQLRLDGGRLEVRVRDDGPRSPEQRKHDLRSARGRGLLIVGSVADDWGHSSDGASKWVWAAFTVGAPERAGDESAS